MLVGRKFAKMLYDEKIEKHRLFLRLVTKFRKRMIGYCLRRGLTIEEAQDCITKGAWETLFPYLGHLPLDDKTGFVKLYTWSVRNHILNMVKKNKKVLLVPLVDNIGKAKDRTAQMDVIKALKKLSKRDRELAISAFIEKIPIKGSKGLLAKKGLDPTYAYPLRKRLNHIKAELREALKDYAPKKKKSTKRRKVKG